MITGLAISKLITKLSLLRYFPAEVEAREALAEAIGEFATGDEQLDWLGAEMIRRYREWPGVKELRSVFCSRFPPQDGDEDLPVCRHCGMPIHLEHASIDWMHGECWRVLKGIPWQAN